MNLLMRVQPVLILGAALVGLGVGATGVASASAALVIEPALMAMLFFVFVAVDGARMRESFANVRFSITALAINFGWTPLFAWGLALLFFPSNVDIQIGLVMLLVMPCTDWYLVFTGLARGNVALGASILPMNLLVQVVALPLYLMAFFGGAPGINAASLVTSALVVLGVPAALAGLVRGVARRVRPAFLERVVGVGDGAQLVFLCVAVAAMFASEADAVLGNLWLLIGLLPPLALFFTVNYVVSWRVDRAISLPSEDTVSLVFTTLARNSPLALAIAVAAFPDRPLIALALALGPLIELPVLGVASRMALRLRSRDDGRPTERP